MMSMDLFEAVNGRRSIRSYLDKPVEGGAIGKLLTAAAYAPSAMNSQQWRFTVIENRQQIQRLSDEAKKNLGLLGRGLELAEVIASKEDTIFYSAPLLIIISAKKDDKWAKVDCGLAAQNMMLAAYGMGLGSCYIGLANGLNKDRSLVKGLGIPDDHEIIAPIIFGYPKKGFVKIKERKAQILKWIK
ncbi:MAG: nitroreductase family protein [Candidatus Altiarchaeota archaeon]